MILLLSNHRENHRYFETLVRHLDKNAKVIKDKSWSFIDISAFIFFKRLRYDDIYQYWLKERIAETQKAANSIQAFCFLLSLRLNYAKNIYRLKKHRPKTVVLWNGLKPQRAIMVAAAAELQINCVFMENGLLPNTTVFDQKGVNALNSMPRDAAFYQALPSRSYTPKKLVAREAKRNKISSEKSLPDKYIFIPFQVDSDSQIVMFSPWIRNMSELFQLGLELQQQVPEYKVV
ncbi:MAG: hypothetical protein HRU21_10025, partial [Pseudomonadales bacterium]|nr:hypothetical protein [Pseudomonadales bacterium]